MSDSVHSLTSKLHNTTFFNLQESRILAHLIIYPNLNTVKEICNELNIPDSKVYPALKQLEEEEMIYRDSTHRPARYNAPEPQRLSDYLKRSLEKEIDTKFKLCEEIDKQINKLWNPEEPVLGQIAYIFKGKEIISEIRRFFKLAKEKIMLLIAPSSQKYIEIINKEVTRLIENNIRVELAFPSSNEFIEHFEALQQINSPYLKIKESIHCSNSYLVRDRNTMLNITHRERGDVALLTNDSLLVDYIDGCWNNSACCIPNNPCIT